MRLITKDNVRTAIYVIITTICMLYIFIILEKLEKSALYPNKIEPGIFKHVVDSTNFIYFIILPIFIVLPLLFFLFILFKRIPLFASANSKISKYTPIIITTLIGFCILFIMLYYIPTEKTVLIDTKKKEFKIITRYAIKPFLEKSWSFDRIVNINYHKSYSDDDLPTGTVSIFLIDGISQKVGSGFPRAYYPFACKIAQECGKPLIRSHDNF